MQGIYVVVSVKCNNVESHPFNKQYQFWLPRSVLDASLSLREKIHVNRVFDIPDNLCEKSVKFFIKGVEPYAGFKLLLKALEKANIKYEIIKEEGGK